MATLKHRPGDKLEVFDCGTWAPCVILRIADYVGKSGPGYYASYDPPRQNCASFWCCDPHLRFRDLVADDMSTIIRTPDSCARVIWPEG